jgi:hypothetical protein
VSYDCTWFDTSGFNSADVVSAELDSDGSAVGASVAAGTPAGEDDPPLKFRAAKYVMKKTAPERASAAGTNDLGLDFMAVALSGVTPRYVRHA